MIEYFYDMMCEWLMLLEIPFFSMNYCELGQSAIIGMPFWPNFNLYDVRLPCVRWGLCYPDSGLSTMFNNKDIRDRIGVEG